MKEHILVEDLDVVALQDIIKLDFSDKELKELSVIRIFAGFGLLPGVTQGV